MFSEEQKKAIDSYEGPFLCLGTPGSGKTTVMIERAVKLIKDHGIAPKNILIITFTKEAAVSMEKRYKALAAKEGIDGTPRLSTFHAFFYWIVRNVYGFDYNAVLTENEIRDMLRTILREREDDYQDNEERLSSLIRQFGIISCDMIDINNYYSDSISEMGFREIYDAYRRKKQTSGKLDFDDMQTMCLKILDENPKVLNRLREIYPFIMVDEFQDTSRIQYEILKRLSNPKNNIFVVGDDDQSIYSFRGARPEVLFSFRKDFKDTEILRLSANYRCPGNIVEASDRLIRNNRKRYEKQPISAAGVEGKIEVIKIPRVNDESLAVIERLRNARNNGTKFEDMAVLYRTNESPRRLIYKLKEFDIPFRIRDMVNDIYDHFAVRILLDYMRFASGDNTRRVFLNIMNKPVRYISRDMLVKDKITCEGLLAMTRGRDYLTNNINDLYRQLNVIRRLDPYAASNYIRKAVGIDAYINEYASKRGMDPGEAMDIMDDFMETAKEYESFPELFEYIDDYRRLIKESETKKEIKDGVSLLTMHSAKGLEFSEVHVIDCINGMIPHRKEKTAAGIDEERRMFYVAVTRSSKNLYLYVPKERSGHETTPSMFIEEMEGKR